MWLLGYFKPHTGRLSCFYWAALIYSEDIGPGFGPALAFDGWVTLGVSLYFSGPQFAEF